MQLAVKPDNKDTRPIVYYCSKNGNTVRRYYKEGWYIPWYQPTVTSNTDYGTISCSSVYSDKNVTRSAWKAVDGMSESSNAHAWGTSNKAIGWWNWALPETICIKGIHFINRTYSALVDYQLINARFFTDSTQEVPIGDVFSIDTSGTAIDVTGIPTEGVLTNNVYFYKEGNTYSGIGELKLIAYKYGIVPGTPDDYDYYTDYTDLESFAFVKENINGN